MFTLKADQIAALKIAIANREGILECDITDETVFQYIRDISDEDGITTHGSTDPDEWSYFEPEMINDKVNWMLESTPDYKSWI